MKKVFVFFMTVMIIFSAVPAMADIKDTSSSEQYDSLYQKRLEGLGIIPEGLDLNGELTRASLADFIANVFADDNITPATQRFSDVPESHPSFKAIYMLYDLGIVGGYSDGTFKPDKSATYIELVNALVCMTGYKIKAEQNGGFPAGYILTAAQMGILPAGVSYKQDDEIKMKDAIYMLYEAMQVPVMERQYGSKKGEYVINNAHTLMGDVMDRKHLNYAQGVVVSNGITNINRPVEKQKDIAVIDSVTLHNYSLAIDDYLGKYVEYWYNHEDTLPTLTYVYEYGDNNRVVTYGADEIVSADFNKYVVTNDAGKQEELPLSHPSVVYNGQGLDNIAKDKLIPSNGIVTLVDNNNDGRFEVVFVYDDDVYVVSDIAAGGYNIIFKNPRSPQFTNLYVDKDDDKTTYIVKNSDGQIISPMEVGVDDVVSIERSPDGKIITVYDSKNEVDGSVEELNETDGVIKIGGAYYDIAKVGGRYIDLGVDINSSGIFYLDKDKKVVYYEKGWLSKSIYAYFITYGAVSGLSGDVETKVVTAGSLGSIQNKNYWWVRDRLVQSDAIKIYKLADNVQLDDTQYKLYDIRNNMGLLSNYKYKVVKIELSDEDKITSIHTLSPDFEMLSGKYNHNTNSLVDGTHALSLSGNVKCLAIPALGQTSDNQYSDDAILAKYRVENGQTHNVLAYGIPADSQVPQLLVMKVNMNDKGSASNLPEDVQIIESVASTQDADYGSCYKISYFDMGGNRGSAIVRPNATISGKSSLSALRIGDIIFMYKDSKGYVLSIEVRESLIRPSPREYGVVGDVVYGKVNKITYNAIWEGDNEKIYNIFSVDTGNGNITRVAAPADRVAFKFNRDANKINVVNIKDIVTGSVGDDMLFKRNGADASSWCYCAVVIN